MSSDATPRTDATVVVIHDDPAILDRLCDLVRRAGVCARPFARAEAALLSLDATAPPALIVAALAMPDLDGRRFCRLLRSEEHASFGHVPILLVSDAAGNEEQETMAASLDAEALVRWPADGPRLVQQVEALVRDGRRRHPVRLLMVQGASALEAPVDVVLAARGYRVDRAHGAAEALAVVGRAPYGVVVIDDRLPDGDPETLLRALLARRPDGLYVVAVDDPDEGSARAWTTRGAMACIGRPIGAAPLLDLCARARAVRAWLGGDGALERRTRELRESEARYRQVIETISDYVYTVHVEHGTAVSTTHGPGCQTVTGYTEEDFARDPFLWLRMVPPDDRELVIEQARRAAAGADVTPIEHRLVRKDGDLRWVRNTPVLHRRSDGTITRYEGIIHDITERMRADEAIRRSRDLLDATQRLAKVGGWEWDVARHTMTWTDEAYRIHGLQPGEIPSGSPDHIRRSLACYDAQDRQIIEEAFRRCVEHGESYDLEFALTSAQGRRLWIETTARPVMDGVRVAKVIGNIVDITARRRAEEALRLQHELVVTLSRTSDLGTVLELCLAAAIRVSGMDSGGLYLIDADTRALHLAAHTGLSADFVARAAVFGPGTSNARLVEAGTPLYTTHAQLAPDAQRAHEGLRALAVIPIVHEGRAIACLNLASHQRNEEADEARPSVEAVAALAGGFIARAALHERLKESESLHRMLMDSIDAGIVVIDPQTHVIEHVNAAAARLVGRPADEIRGQVCHRFLCPTEPGQCPVTDEGRDVECAEHTLLQQGGGTLPVLKSVRRIRIGGHDKLLETFLDISERRHAEEERERLRAQLILAQRMESIGRLAGGVAHDFNNMLGGILGHVELALDKVDSADPVAADLREIQTAAERSADLTRQLLAFARKQTIAPRVLDLNGTVETMLKMLRRLMGEDIELVWRPGQEVGRVKVDPSQIDQILANLCVNARDAIGETGVVTIETAHAVFDEADCATRPGAAAGRYARLTVSDTGCGMDTETRSRLFEPFFTTKALGKGTGLGLATVYGIVQQNRGFIEVDSEPGRGTTLRIYLPTHRDEAEPAPQKPSQQPPASGRETILLVEDESVILNITTVMLERLGYRVLAAATPGEAIRLASESPGAIHLLVTDVVMPGMNGHDLANRVMSFHPRLERLFMSGYTADVIAHHGVLDEGVHFLQKPFSMAELATAVRTALGETSPTSLPPKSLPE